MKDKNTKTRIVEAAWQLFYEHGYDATTVEDVVRASGTSKGSFYHYFEGKDALLGSLAYLFDAKYAELEGRIDPAADAFEVLLFLNRELFDMIEKRIDVALLSRLLASQLMAKGERALLDRDRYYYKLLRRLVLRGQERGELTEARSAGDIVKLYAMAERALLYDWCLSHGEQSLREVAARVMPGWLSSLRPDGK
ncbi:MAG: TetR/AcrR family transcriptional regulator [Clostridia bacterium]|nr:TetR/AcrR family transcriptional regulator [Clostridia bacterium]